MNNFSSSKFDAINVDQKRPNDRRVKRTISLPNKLQVLLISDPDINQSAAAMDVGVGFMADPKENLGLAHFLEHMLFLGTEKYPVVGEYDQFLKSYNGMSNAYTASERTNYFFEINHDGFPEALDRFGQFFISPLFNKEFVEREMNAVNSEFEKNLQSDIWRVQEIFRKIHRPEHPINKFSTGSLETLKNTSRETLINFYNTYYSADAMRLAIMSKISLDEMETMVRSIFQNVPNHNRGIIPYSGDFFDPKDLPRMVQVKSVKNLKKLSLIFAIPSQDQNWESKPGSILTDLIGYEGEHSLLSFLKTEQLATGLSTSIDSSYYGGYFQVDISLTDKGLQNPNRIIESFFSFVSVLKAQGLPEYIFQERKMMADLNFVYQDAREGGNFLSQYASLMQKYPVIDFDLDKRETLFFQYNEKEYLNLLSYLKPDQLNAILVKENAITDKIEPYYQSSYGISKFSKEELASFEKPKKMDALALPKPNPFIPHKLVLNTSKVPTEPKKIIDSKWGDFWFQQDDTFFLPKGSVKLELLTDKVNRTPKEKALSTLYQMAVVESHNEWSYDVTQAGLDFSLSRTDKGMQLDFGGYSEKLPLLVQEVQNRLTEITINPETFETLKSDYKRSIANSYFEAAYNQAMYEASYLQVKNLIHRKDIFNPETKVDVISSITLDDVKAFAKTVYETMAIKGLAYGSFTPDVLKDAINSYPEKLGKDPLAENLRGNPERLKLSDGEEVALTMGNKTNNGVFAMYIPFGARDFSLNAALRIGITHLAPRFYTELRTKQQLGYLVHSNTDLQEKVLGLLFLIQSAEVEPLEVSKRVHAFMDLFMKEFEALPAQQFEGFRQAVIESLNQSEKTLYERHGMLYAEIYSYNAQFNYKKKIAEAASKLTQKDVIAYFKKALDDKHRKSLNVYMSQDGHKLAKPRETVIKNSEAFKKSMKVY